MTTGSVLTQFTITLTQAASEPVLVDWYTSDGTAKAGVDYAAGKGTATFAPGETSKTISILVYGRAVGSEDRSFFVEMLPPVNAILGASIGECIIHVDTTGSTPVTVIIVPTGPRGLEGKSAYQVWLDLGNTGTEQDFIDSLSPPTNEIAAEVAPLIDVGSTTLTSQDTESLSHPDATTVKAVARRVAYVGAAKIATVVLADGDNLIAQADLVGNAVDLNSVGLYPRIARGTTFISPQWDIQTDGKLLIKDAVAGDVLYVCQYDLLSRQAIVNVSKPLALAASEELRLKLMGADGSSMIGGALYSDITSYSGTATRLELYGGLATGDGGEGVFIRDPSDTTSPAVTGLVSIDALNRRWKREYQGDVQAKWFLIKGDKVTDDTARFVEAAAYCKANKKRLRIDNMKIVLRTLSASINLDDWRVVGNGVPSTLPVLHMDYLNGADQADAVWLQEADFIGSAIYCPANIAIFTGKAFNVSDVLLVGDYNKSNNHAFYQSAPTAYPGWSRALEGSSCTAHYFGGYGVYLLGGLEVCNPKNIRIAFTKQNNLRVDGLNASINCPIEYLHFDDSNYFMYSKANNVLINGMRKHVRFDKNVLLNGPGQFDVVKHFNPSFSLASIGEALAAVSVVAAPPGTYGGLAHSGSYGLIFGGYAEACQNLLTISNGFLNDVEMNDTTMYVVDPAWPKAQLITYNAISKISTKGNKLSDGKFYYWFDTATRNALAALEIGEEALGAAVNAGSVVDPNKKIIPNFNGPWLQLGNGAGGDARFDLDNYFPIVTPVGASAKPIMLLVTSNLGTTATPSMGAYIVIASRHASNSWIGVVIPSGNNSGFASQPALAADGQLSMSLSAGYYASVTRVDGLALK